MMQERLILARQLLKEDGVIFVSINDSEQAYLKVLMDEIFGEDNFVTNINWYNKKEGRSLGNKLFSSTFEYILVYSKNKNLLNTNYVVVHEEKELSKYVFEDKRGKYKKGSPLFNHNIKNFNELTRKNLAYRIFVNPNTNEIAFENLNGFIEIFPPYYGNIKGCWTWSKEKVIKERDLLFIDKYKDGYMIYKKAYLNGEGKKLVSPKNSITFFLQDDENILNIRNTGKLDYSSVNSNDFDTPNLCKL